MAAATTFADVLKREFAEAVRDQMNASNRLLFGPPDPKEVARRERVVKLCREQGHEWGPVQRSSGECYSCEGQGVWVKRGEWQDCYDCDGTGRIPIYAHRRCARECNLPDAYQSNARRVRGLT